MTILRLNLQDGGWRAVSPKMFEDHRLSLDTRGVAGYIATRSDSFTLSVAGLCRLLGIGDEKWRRISSELIRAGYLVRVPGKDSRGRFRHELRFSPTPNPVSEPTATSPKSPGRPAVANPYSGQPSAAKPGTTRNTRNHKSDHHHQEWIDPKSTTDAELPPLWVEAARFEIKLEESVRQIRSAGGLFRTIIERYRKNGGPDGAVLDALEAHKKKEMARTTKVLHDEQQAQTVEQAPVEEALRRSQAESIARTLTREARQVVLSRAETAIPNLKIGKNAKSAFLDSGTIRSGPHRLALIQCLLSSHPLLG